jgi:DNA mismatch endonuclease (patch repair protein)
VDNLTPTERSAQMRLVTNRDTGPEIAVRRLVSGLGYRYRLHVRRLPGSPDLVFARLKKVIFVHGCFWHRHGSRCPLTRWPKTRLGYWKPKLLANHERDRRHRRALRRLGWRVLVIWECQLRKAEVLTKRVARFLEE